MKNSLYEFQSYREYLQFICGPQSKRQGVKSKLALALKCQSSYLSRVLNGQADLSLEQIDLLATHLNLLSNERDYLFLLLQKERAGTQSLQKYFEEKIHEFQKNNRNIKSILNEEEKLPLDSQIQYYSSIKYLALHVACTLPNLRTPEKLAAHFKMENSEVMSILEFLVKCKLLKKEGHEYTCKVQSVFLENKNPLIYTHHANMRLHTIDKMKENKRDALHYSALASLSQKDFEKIRERLLSEIKSNVDIIRSSKEEKLCIMGIDFYTL